MSRFVAVNDKGYRIGQDHQHAKLTDAEVEMVFKLRADGLTFRQIKLAMGIGLSTISDYLSGRRRAQVVARFRAVRVTRK